MTPSPSAKRTSSATDRTLTSGPSCWPCTRKSSRRSSRCCGRKRMFRLRSLLIAFTLVCVLPVFAEDDDARFELKYAKDFTFKGGRVVIDHAFGNLSLRTHA